MADKVKTLEEAAELVPDGATVAHRRAVDERHADGVRARADPARRARTSRWCRSSTAWRSTGWSPRAASRRVIAGLVSFEGFGLAPAFRAAVQSGRDGAGGVQRAHADLRAAGRSLQAAVHPDQGRPRHRHARRCTPTRPGSRQTRRPGSPTSRARRCRRRRRSCTPMPPTSWATCASTRSWSGWTTRSSRRPP